MGSAYGTLDELDVLALPRALAMSHRLARLSKILMDVDWLRRKLQLTGPEEVVADFEYLPSQEAHERVQDAIIMSSECLRKYPALLEGQLYARLMCSQSPAIRQFLRQITSNSRSPWIRTVSQTLVPAGNGLLRTLAGHEADVKSVAVAANGQIAVSGSLDKTVRVWDLDNGEPVLTLKDHKAVVRSVSVTPDGRFAASGGDDDTVRVWDLRSGAEIAGLQSDGDKSRIHAAAITPEGDRVVFAPGDDTLRLWNLRGDPGVRIFEGPRVAVASIGVSGDARIAVSTSDGVRLPDSQLHVWDIEAAKLLRTLGERWGEAPRLRGVCLTSDGRYAITAASDYTLKMWDLHSGRVIRTIDTEGYYVSRLAVSGDGSCIIGDFRDNRIRSWDLTTGEPNQDLHGHGSDVWALAMTSDGRSAVSGSADRTVRLWDLSRADDSSRVHGHGGFVATIAISHDGHVAVSASGDRTLKVWKVSTGLEQRTLEGHKGWVKAVAITPDGTCAISATSGPATEGPPKVWDVKTGTLLRSFEETVGKVQCLVACSNGEHVISASERLSPMSAHVTKWDLKSGRLLRTVEEHTHAICSIAVTPDERHIVSASQDGTLKVRDIMTLEELRSIHCDEHRINSLAVTPNGRMAVFGAEPSATNDGWVGLWDLEEGGDARLFRIHDSWITGVAVFPDGLMAVSTFSDGMLKVWDIVDGNTLAGFCGDAPLSCCAVAPNGRTLVVGETSGQVHFLGLEGPPLP